MRLGRPETAGTLLAAASAVSYGVTIVVNRELATRGFGPEATLSFRFGIAAVATGVLLAALRRPLLPAPGERGRVLLLGAVGYATESALFYSALQRGSAAAVALVFYSYPGVVAAIEIGVRAVRPSGRLLGALAVSIAGTALVVATGRGVEITGAGAVLAMGAALSYAVYVLAGSRVVTRTEPLTTGAWVALGACLSLTALGVVGGSLRAPGSAWWLLLLDGLATASAFCLLFAALRRLGATRTSVVMTLEALSAVVLGAAFLGERLGGPQLAGGAAILAAAAAISLMRTKPPAMPVEEL
ncbi:MAG TPA: DMT family transporter [Acidimicrobiales bacterium]|nr:DMT family transporter [Acidimicrobiales bacterium]